MANLKRKDQAFTQSQKLAKTKIVKTTLSRTFHKGNNIYNKTNKMAVQVTGLFQSTATGLIYQSPLLTLVPHLAYAGMIKMDVYIADNGAIGYENIDKSTLTYDPTITDPYSQLIDALDTFVIDNLKDANEINSQATFEKYNPPAPEPTPTPEEPVVEEVGGE